MIWAKIGAAMMFIGVAMGAFGAHALKTRLAPNLLEAFETGIRYQFVHGLGLFVVAWLAETRDHALLSSAGWLFTVGITLFSGSLYALSLSGARGWGMVTPLGGLCFLAGWICLSAALVASA